MTCDIEQILSSLAKDERLIHLPEVLRKTSIGKTTAYDWMKRGLFPRSISIGARVSWRETEINRWIAEKIAASQCDFLEPQPVRPIHDGLQQTIPSTHLRKGE